MSDAGTVPRGVIGWFATNRVAANLLMVFVLVAGGLSLLRMKVEVFQEVDPGLVRVEVPYPGATPAEVEEGICLRVEEAIKGIEGIKQLRAEATEGMGFVVAELEDYADGDAARDDIKTAVGRIRDFPPRDAEAPVVVDVDSNIQVISVVVYGDASERALKEAAGRARDELTTMSNISLVDVVGTRRYEISIEVSEASLRRHAMTFGQVADAVRSSSLDLPGGSIKTAGGHILLRTKGQRYRGADFESIAVMTQTDGTVVYLDDVATVVDGFEDSDIQTYFDGKPAVLLKVYRVGGQGALNVARTVKAFVEEADLPPGIAMTTWFDRSEYLRGRINLLVRNAAIGGVFVLLALLCFLDLRLALWTTLGIPISFMGGFAVMGLVGVSINMISLFALIVVLGIVVDDAIVVGENVFAHRQRGLSPMASAYAGVREMAAPVIMAVLTTIAAFGPLMFTRGELGKILWPIPAVVSCVLAISLVEALLILPAHLSGRGRQGRPGPLERFQASVRGLLDRFVRGPYRAVLKRAVRWRYVTVAIAIAIFALLIGALKGGYLESRFMPDVDADNVWATLVMPQGTPVEQTRRVVAQLEDAVMRVRAAKDSEHGLEEQSIISHVSTTVGDQPFSRMARGGGAALVAGPGGGRSHVAEVNVELMNGRRRPVTSKKIAEAWRQAVGELPGISSLTFTSQFFSAGEAVHVQLSHHDVDKLQDAVETLKQDLAPFRGVTDIADSFVLGKRELGISITPAGRSAGLVLEDIARQVRQAFYGEEVQRVQRGRDDVRVMVRYPMAYRKSLADIENLRIRLPNGTQAPFRTVAVVKEGRGYATIERTNRKRSVKVTAAVERGADPQAINNAVASELLPALVAAYPGLSCTLEGEQRDQRESLQSMGVNMLMGLLIIFCLLAVQFRSYVQPLIVMSVIPFGLVGAALGHVIMGLSISMLSGFGAVALTGVVVNDSLIMIDLINRRRREGVALRRAVLESGVRRFRPILLTTLTTFFGLMPMILEQSLQAQFLIPMAVSLGFGVVFATAVTLLLVPSVYTIIDDVQGLFGENDEDVQAVADEGGTAG